jgi:demethylmenaquinone methyltransferase/2-methoxy-6-polyprenyl-1,4-benzoquinol methylase
LEFSQPRAWLRPFYYFYLRHILPFIAAVVTGDKSAYDYLCGSIEEFPSHEGIANEMKATGFEIASIQRMTGGIVALHGGRKNY